MLVAVVALAAALVLSAVFLGIFGGGTSSGSPSNGNGSTFSSARGVADEFAAAHGSWVLIDGVGVALPNASYFPYTGSGGNASCIPITLAGTVPINLTLPAFHGDLASGAAPVWLFAYLSVPPETGGELAVFEIGDRVALAVELPAGCIEGISLIHGISPSVIDSSTAVAAAAAAGGAKFLQAHPTGVSLEMEIIGGFSAGNGSLLTPSWEVIWSTCSNTLFGTGGETSGYQFFAAVNATTASVLPGSIENTTCSTGVPPPPTGIAGAISFGTPSLIVGPGSGGTIASQGCNSGDYCYIAPITAASDNLTPSDFELAVQNFSDGSTITTILGFAIVSVTGTVLVYSTGDIESLWSPGAGNAQTLLGAGMAIYVDTGPTHPTASNLGLVLTGEGPFADSIFGITL